MKKRALPLILCCILSGNLIFAQSSEVIRNYISRYKNIAMLEMQRTGVPAAITLAQGIHETGAGTSDLVRASNNHFGIKCKSEWTGATVYHDDDARGECFRKYDDPMDSYRDHSDFLKNRPYYAALFRLDPTDYEGWAFGLKKAGYATNPKYPQILIRLIREYNLQDYTLIAMGRKAPGNGDAIWASQDTRTQESGQEDKNAVVTAVKKETVSYPSGTFRINQTNVVWIGKGTSYLKVAEDHHVSLSRLFDFNDMTPGDIAPEDQLLYVQRKRKTGSSEFHILAQGETLHDVAQREGIRLENLLEYNFLREGMQPRPGEKLYLQGKAPAMPRLTMEGPADDARNDQAREENEKEFIVHVVKPKETMFAIARKYAVAVNDVMQWNEMRTMNLKTGQQLKINKRSIDATN